ncbi:glycosyltransferase [Arcobacter peruensis]|uniref:glycosyltransferase n=1 Tax=Arcobacter peruensis TaxID=2320140 RepID=UPI000F08BFBE|nr:glycosyltransferase [Arcobacter peruensis]
MTFTGERFIPQISDKDDEIIYEHYNRYYSILPNIKGKKILDAASGSGYGSYLLSEFASEVTGIDISKEAIEFSRENYINKNLIYEVSSIERLPFDDNSFDVIVSFETIEHVNEKVQSMFLKECKRVLKEDGFLIISTPDKKVYSDNANYNNEFHIKEFYENEFHNFLKTQFSTVSFLYQRNEVCNIISANECEVTNIIRKKYVDSSEGKYIIAICRNKEIDLNVCSSIQILTNEYKHRINRIIELQNEVEEKNQWAFSLKEEINKKDNLTNELNSRISELETQIVSVESVKSNLEDSLSTSKEEINKKDNLTNELNSRISELETQIVSVESVKSNLEDSLSTSKEEINKKDNLTNELNSRISELETQIVSVESVKSNLEDSLSTSKEEINKKDNLTNELNSRISELETQIVSVESVKSNLEDSLSTSKEEINKKDNLTNELNSRISELETQIVSVESVKSNLEDSLSTSKEEINKKDNLTNELNSRISELETQIVSVESVKSNLEDSLSTSKEEINKKDNLTNELNSRISELETQIVSVESVKSNLEDSLSTSKEEINKKDNLTNELNSRISELETQIVSVESVKSNLEDSLSTSKEEINKKDNLTNELNSRISELETQIVSVESVKSNLEDSLSTSKEEINKKDNLTNELNSRISELETQIVSVESVKSNLEDSLSTSKEEINKKDNLTNELNSRISELETQIVSVESVKSNLEDSLSTSKEEINKKDNLTNELNSRISELETQIVSVESVKSNLEDSLSTSKEEINKKDKQIILLNKKAERSYMKSKNIESFQHQKLKYQYNNLKNFFKSVGSNPFKLFSKVDSLKSAFKNMDEQFNQIPRKFLEEFNSGKYLEANHDVKEAIDKQEFENALEHFIFFGFEEVKNGCRKIDNRLDYFNNTEYLKSHSDVIKAIKNNQFQNAFEHYLIFGYKEIINQTRYEISQNNEKLNLKIIDPLNIILGYSNIISVPKFDKPLVSIVIPAYNQANYTLACIQSIIENTTIAYEIILMDDKSPDEDARNLKHLIENIKFISNEENLGFLKNCNKGASFAVGKYVLFLNNDTNVQQDWLKYLIQLIESDDKIGMVGSRLVYPDGRQQEAGGIIWNDASGWNFGRLDDPMKPEYNYVKEVDYISGAAIMLSKKLWDEIGGFDERYIPAYYEDSDLAFEVRKHGYKVMYQPKSIVVHFEGISHGTDLGLGIKSYQVTNKEKFIDKWKNELEEQYPNGEDVFLARDRSKTKKHILIIDHYVPHFDQDAGSRTVYGYIKMFISSGYNVKFIGDNYFPHQPYTKNLEDLGVEVLYGNWYANNWKSWLSSNAKYFDYIFMNRPHISEKYIDILKSEFYGKTIYYGHDLHSLRDSREYLLTKDKEKLLSAESWRDREFKLMRKSDISFYPSQVEIDEIKKIDNTINVRAIPAYLFEDFKKVNRNVTKTNDIMFVGGFGHSPNEDAVLWFVECVWPIIRNKINDVKFYIIGSKPTESIKKLATKDIIVTGFISDEELSKYYNKCRIAVVPLRYGAGIKGKVVEALYEEIPIVTTTTGAEGLMDAKDYMVIEDEKNKFAEKIINLYKNESELIHFSNKGREYCKQYFSYKYAKKVLNDVFDFGALNDSKK